MHHKKLSQLDADEIRQLYASGKFTHGALARRFRVSVNSIGRILRGESWQGERETLTPAEMDRRADEFAKKMEMKFKAGELEPEGGV